MAEKIKVLIVDDNEDTREGTRRLVQMEDDIIEIVGFAENGQEALERVKQLQPHVVLMDINMPLMNGIEATQRLQEDAPRTKVIVVSVQDDAHYLKQAFRAGAVDFVAKPITSGELVQAIERAYRSIPPETVAPPAPAPGQVWPGQQWGGPPRPEGHIVCVLGFKGGVGKTTLAVNLGIGLVKAGKKVVVVDTNLYFGDVGLFLNARGQHTLVDLVRVTEDPAQMDPQDIERMLFAHEGGVRLALAPKKPTSEAIPAESLFNLLTYLKQDNDYVILDTSTTLDVVLDTSIQAAERLLVVLTPTMPAIKDTQILLALLTEEGFGDKVTLVLNQVDKTSRITGAQISNSLKQPIALEIPTDPWAVEAVNQGIALITLDQRRVPSVRSLMDMVQLVRNMFETTGEAVPQEEQQRPRKWF